MKRYLFLLLGILFVGSIFFSACSSQHQGCAAYSTYPKKKRAR